MRIKKILVLIITLLMIVGCVDNSNKIKLNLSQNFAKSTNQKLSFIISISTDSESELSISVYEDIYESLLMLVIKNDNLCKNTPFYINKGNSDIVEINFSKKNPYIVEVSADYKFDQINNLYIYDFGEFGKFCTNQRNKKFKLGFSLYESSTYKNLFVYRSNGVTSNKLNVGGK